MKIILRILSVILVCSAIVMSLIVIIDFFYQVSHLYKSFPKLDKLNELAQIGDFFSGHINGFILFALIISLFYQRTSISQTEKSITEQSKANETISKDLNLSIEANMLQTKEFIVSNILNDFHNETNKISNLIKELELDKLVKDNYKQYCIIDNNKLVEFLERLNYVESLIKSIQYEDLKTKANHKLVLLKQNKFTEDKKELLKKVFVFNELIVICKEYINFLKKNYSNNTKIDDINDLNIKFVFLNNYEFKSSFIKNNETGLCLFEKIDCNKFCFFEEEYKLNFQELWNIIFIPQYFPIDYEIKLFYRISKSNYVDENI